VGGVANMSSQLLVFLAAMIGVWWPIGQVISGDWSRTYYLLPLGGMLTGLAYLLIVRIWFIVEAPFVALAAWLGREPSPTSDLWRPTVSKQWSLVLAVAVVAMLFGAMGGYVGGNVWRSERAPKWEFESSYWGIYEQAVGLSAGRGNRFQQWLREQGFPTYAAFIFEVTLLGNYPEITVENFLDYIAVADGKSTRANGDALAAFGALSTKEQRSFLAALPVDTEEQRQRFEQELLHGGLRERYGSLAADGRTSSAYGGEKRRAFELSPDAQEMTFLEYLRRENELR